MLTQIVFYDRRKNSPSLQINNRRNGERRQCIEAYFPERRRPASKIRCEEREAVALPIRLEIEGKDEVGHTVNISSRGLMIQTKMPLREGLEVFLHFSSNQGILLLV